MTEIVKIGNATLYNADFRDVLPTLSGFDVIVTDPPYGIGFKYESHQDNGGDEYMDLIANLKGYPLALLQYPEEMMKYVCPVLGAPDEVFIWCYNSNLARQSRIWGFWECHVDFSAVKQPPKNPNDLRIINHETSSFGVSHYDWVSDIQQVKNVSKEKTDHPCQLPISLVERVIKFVGGEIVLDPFLGSGTTGLACISVGCSFIGIEKDKKYFDIACERIEKAQAQERLFA